MKRVFLVFAGLVLVFALAMAGCLEAVRAGYLTPGDDELRARYQLPGSHFMEIDGEPIHYVDEGGGDAIILVHGSFGSLRMWRDWAASLSGRYRVVRFDRPPMGLSGPDPVGRYDPDREIAIIDRLATRLGIDRFFLVATSSGGIAGAGYAAEHPDRVRGLVLSNIAVGPFTMDRGRLSDTFKWLLAVDPYFNGWHPDEFWRQILLANLDDPGKVTPSLVREWADLNNRAQRMKPAPGSASIASTLARTPDDLPKITAPSLLIWSADDAELPADPVGRKALALLGSADKSLVVVPRCGHIMPIDCGPESVALAGPFFDRLAAGTR